MVPFIPIIGSVISGVSGYFSRKQENAQIKETAKAKLSLKKQGDTHKVTITDAEWEAIGQKGLTESWKDEYITLIITSPIVGVIVGSVWEAFTGNSKLLDGTLRGVAELAKLGLNWEYMTLGVVFAAIGLKLWRAER